MPAKPLSPAVMLAAYAAVRQHGDIQAAARALGISGSTMDGRYRACLDAGWEDVRSNPRALAAMGKQPVRDPEFVAIPPVDAAEPIDDLLAARRKRFQRLAEAKSSRKIIQVTVQIDGPYGVLHMGDPHVDDDGCNLALLEHHMSLVNGTEGLFAGNVGDLHNNWIGRLARLYSAQSTTASDAVRLVEWFISSVRWLYLIGGNHDCWSGAQDPVRWFAARASALYEWHGIRLALRSPSGTEIRINGRHDFAGSSQWNLAHAPSKAAQLAFERDHIYICGHRHAAGGMFLNWEDGSHTAHALRVGAYKFHDDYSEAKGFPRQNIPAVLTVHNPGARTPAGLVTPFWDADEGASYLRWLRSSRLPAPAKRKSA
jgi:hypothetical protein